MDSENAREKPRLQINVGKAALPSLITTASPIAMSSPRLATELLKAPLTPSEAQSIIRKQTALMGNVLRSANNVPADVQVMSCAQLADLLSGPAAAEILLIDVRPVVPSSSKRIVDAISLCVPSTLLKRGSFGLDRVIELMGAGVKERLNNLEQNRCVVLYDDSTLDLKTCGPNSLYHAVMKVHASGRAAHHLYYLQGGFAQFKQNYPSLLETPPEEVGDASTEAPGTTYLSATSGTSPSTPFSLRPVLTSLRASPTWTRVPPASAVAAVDNSNLRILDLVMDSRNRLPYSLRQVVDEALDGRNPIAERFSKLQAEEQARLTQAYFRDVGNSGNSSGNSSTVSARLLKSANSRSSASTVSPCLSPLPTSDESFEYVLYTGTDQTKNRYSNICPYDHTRVLVGQDGYINASYIRTSISRLRYIATQAPVPNSFSDFWRVIFDHKVPVVVMLTALTTQGGQAKSHKYWSVGNYDGIEIVSVEEELFDEDEYLTVRHIVLRRGNETHRLAHMQYLQWTDLGCPAKIEDATMLVRLKDQLLRDHKHTEDGSDWVVVHCSAGCGRTGSFCIIDSVIDFYRRLPMSERLADVQDHIYDTVHELRRQRIGMVQVQRQFSLCYEAVILWYCRHYLSDDSEEAEDSEDQDLGNGCARSCCASPSALTAASRSEPVPPRGPDATFV